MSTEGGVQSKQGETLRDFVNFHRPPSVGTNFLQTSLKQSGLCVIDQQIRGLSKYYRRPSIAVKRFSHSSLDLVNISQAPYFPPSLPPSVKNVRSLGSTSTQIRIRLSISNLEYLLCNIWVRDILFTYVGSCRTCKAHVNILRQSPLPAPSIYSLKIHNFATALVISIDPIQCELYARKIIENGIETEHLYFLAFQFLTFNFLYAYPFKVTRNICC